MAKHFDNLLNIYNEIKEEAIYNSDNLLSDDFIGFKNVSSKFINLVEKSVDISISNRDEIKDESDHEEDNYDF